MPQRKIILTVLFSIIFGLLLPSSMVSCHRSSAIIPAPDDPGPVDAVPDMNDPLHQIPLVPGKPPIDMLEENDLNIHSIDDVAVTLNGLQLNGGGVTTIELDEGVLVVHVFDPLNGNILQCEAVIVAGDNPGALFDINGIAVFENVEFPVTITVNAEGYALSTLIGTSANVISIPLTRIEQPGKGNIFGVAEKFGYKGMYFYSDTLLPELITESPVSPDGNYQSFEFDVDPYVVNGMSAFLVGGVDLPHDEIGFDIFGLPVFWMTNHFAWDLGQIEPGDRLFHLVDFYLGISPAGVVSGTVSLPEDIGDLEGARLWALPTAILLDGERYLAMGPHRVLEGDDPDNIEYRCPFFNSKIPEDRLVLAAQLELADGSADIVHAIWHGQEELDPIAFSGVPVLMVPDYTIGTGFSHPVLDLENPLGISCSLIKFYAQAEGIGRVWEITETMNTEPVDTADYDIPLPWLRDLLGHANVEFQVECIDTLDQTIDEFTHNDIIMTRNEVAFSAWTPPDE